ncbi:hypothetical protein CO614_02110 [Lysobacteraceae bacterium NML120232]|nr:hypothetical protein CO608_06970 [Xanthomonadaceae bacterium NML08-0793]PJK13186.1 hypothetical protein CO614_02110 [Xanthomonadaceae bacterium NML120232]
MRYASARGFTLMEMIVVMMISGMAVMLGFQSLMQWQQAEATFARIGNETEINTLTAAWWRSSMRGLMPVEKTPFAGNSSNLSGFTINPIFSTSGAMTPIRWQVLESADGGDIQLVLEENGRTQTLPIPEGASAQFAYMDKDGGIHPQWPPEVLGEAPTQLPQAIRLNIDYANGESRSWAAHVVGPLNPYYRAFSVEDDFE